MHALSAKWALPFLALLGFTTTVTAQGSIGGDQSSCSSSQQWVYKGCYDDDGNGRHVNFNWLLSSSSNSERYYPGYTGQVTVDICLKACRGHGFQYAALFYGTECYCMTPFLSLRVNISLSRRCIGASTFPNPDPPTSGVTTGGPGISRGPNKVAESKCASSCTGNSSQICGDGGAANVYQDPSFTNSIAARLPSNYGYLGCFNNVNPGPMYTSIRTTNTTSCLSYCASLGYSFAARSDVDSSTGSTSCGCGTEIQSGLQIEERFCERNCDGSSGAS